MDNKYVGILIAGGKSRRFGSPKAFLKKDGKYFYQHSVEALKAVADSIIVVTNPHLEKQFQGEDRRFSMITDKIEYRGLGPLAGIYSGMEYLSGEWYIVAPIDVPFIDESVFETLISQKEDRFDAIVPIVSGKRQALLAIYHHRVKEVILKQLEKKVLSVKCLLKNLNVKYVTIDNEKAFYNINYKSDYNKWIDS